MDEIIYLEPDEEITSVIDKMKNARTSNIGLVVPREATLLQSVVNLRLLMKEADSLGKKVAIVTSDKIGRNLASQVGIPVFNSIEEQRPIYQPPPPKPSSEEIIEIDMAQKEQEVPPKVKVHHFQNEPVDKIDLEKEKRPIIKISDNKERNIYHNPKDLAKVRKIIWPILGILIILSLIASYLLLPRSQVQVFVKSENLEKSLDVAVVSKVKSYNIKEKVFPGELIEVQKEASQNFPTTGKKNIGEKAQGTIVVYNNFDSESHSFGLDTKFSSSSKTFLPKGAFTVPGATVQNLKIVPGSVSVDIEAENPGEDYNVKAGRFTILGLPADQQEAIYGNSSSDLAGGFSKEVQVVSETDYNQAKETILKDLSAKAQEEFQKKVKGKKILDKAIVNPDPEVTTSAKIDSEASEFEMKIIAKEQVMAFDFDNFKKFVTETLSLQVPSDKMVAIAKDEDLGFEVTKTAYDKEELDIKVNILAKIASKIDASKIQTAILGKNEEEAKSYIKSQEGVEKVEINVWPSWWFKKIPDLTGNVNVKIEYLNE